MEDHLFNEETLLLQMAEDDKQAFQLLFERYWGNVYGIGLQLTKSPEGARDLAQEVFLKVWDQRQKWPSVTHFRAYLYKMVSNMAINQLRSKVIQESNKEYLTQYFTYQPSSPQEELEQKQLGTQVLQAINELPPYLQQVFTLHKMQGLSHEEIARQLDITPLSSKTYMVRALLLLRKKLARNIDILLITNFLIALLQFFSKFLKN